jgi:hypothetical protein
VAKPQKVFRFFYRPVAGLFTLTGDIMSVAEDIVDGTVCSKCQRYFQDPEDESKAYTHGYPVACKRCFRRGMGADGIQKAKAKTF